MVNKKRSILSALSVMIAAFVITLLTGWVNGVTKSYFEDFARYQTGNVKIITPDYLKRERFLPVDEVIPHPQELIKKIKNNPLVKSVEERIRFGLLLGKGDKTSQAIGMGINFQNTTLGIMGHVKNNQGTMVEIDPHNIYIGKKLATKLKAKIGDKLLLVTSTSLGGLNGIKVKIGGYLALGVSMMDDKFFFISLQNAKKLLKLENNGTEIYIYTHDYQKSNQLARELKKEIPPGLKAMSMRDQNKGFFDYLNSIDKIFFLINGIILFLASFIIINTMMMTIFERTQEIGTLKAIGLKDRDLFFQLTAEGGIVGAIGGTIGTFLAMVLLLFLSNTGINLEKALEGMDVPIQYIIYPSAGLDVVVATLFLAIIIPALASAIPAKFVLKLNAAEALRKF